MAKGHKFHTLRGFIKLKDVEIVDVVEVVFLLEFSIIAILRGNVWANSWTFIVYKIFSGPLL